MNLYGVADAKRTRKGSLSYAVAQPSNPDNRSHYCWPLEPARSYSTWRHCTNLPPIFEPKETTSPSFQASERRACRTSQQLKNEAGMFFVFYEIKLTVHCPIPELDCRFRPRFSQGNVLCNALLGRNQIGRVASCSWRGRRKAKPSLLENKFGIGSTEDAVQFREARAGCHTVQNKKNERRHGWNASVFC